MELSDQYLASIKDKYEWVSLLRELKPASNPVLIEQVRGTLQVQVDACKMYGGWESAVIVPCDDPFRLNFKSKGFGAWVIKTATPVAELVSEGEQLRIDMLPATHRGVISRIVGHARWMRQVDVDADSDEWENYRTASCLFGEVCNYKKSEVRARHAD